MSRRRGMLFGLGVVAFAAAGAAVAQPTGPGDAAADLDALRRKVESLEKRVEALERTPRVVLTQPEGSPPSPALPRLRALPPADLPPGTQQREFNGTTYYLIPIDRTTESAAPDRTTAPAVAAPAK